MNPTALYIGVTALNLAMLALSAGWEFRGIQVTEEEKLLARARFLQAKLAEARHA